MSDYEPEYSIYSAKESVIKDDTGNWMQTIREWKWPTSDGCGVLFRKDIQTEPFGPFVTVYKITPKIARRGNE